VVNNAGIQHAAPVEDFDDAKWDAVLAINLSSAFHPIKAVALELADFDYLCECRTRMTVGAANVLSGAGRCSTTSRGATR